MRSRLALLSAILTLGTAATCSGADKPADDSELASADSGADDSASDDSAADDSAADDSAADDSAADDSAADDSGSTDTGAFSVPLLNELLASNEEGITDEAEQNEDWIELYNPSSRSLDLEGWALADGDSRDDPWTFPEGSTIAPYGFLLVWADEDEDDGPLHASFKLSRDGETLVLLDPQGEVVQEVSFAAQSDDISWGRRPDGGATWGFIDPPTPNRANPSGG